MKNNNNKKGTLSLLGARAFYSISRCVFFNSVVSSLFPREIPRFVWIKHLKQWDFKATRAHRFFYYKLLQVFMDYGYFKSYYSTYVLYA